MTLGSLFDGSGGFPLAGRLCGITPLWASEVEPYPIAVTRSRFPEMEHLGDVRKINGGDIQPVDVITFGSPCQGLSVAGERKGLEDARSGLFMEAVRIIREMREATHGAYPKFAFWENVPGAFSSNRGEDFRIVLQSLVQIVEPGAVMPAVPKGGWPRYDHYMGDGWSLAYRTFDAQYWGVPQRRRRIHLVLHLGGERAGAVLFEREGLRGHFAEGGAPGKGAAGDAAGGVGGADCGCIAFHPLQDPIVGVDRTPCISTGNPSNGQAAIGVCYPTIANTLTARNDGSPQPDKGTGANVVVLSAGFKPGQSKAGGLGWQEECAATLSARSSGTEPAVCVKCYDARGNGDGRTASTITGDHENRVTDYTNVVCMAHGQGNAEITYDLSPTLNCDHEQPIVVLDKGAMGVDCRNFTESFELYPTLQAKPNGGQSLNYSGAVRVHSIVRRLTPGECCRLQG